MSNNSLFNQENIQEILNEALLYRESLHNIVSKILEKYTNEFLEKYASKRKLDSKKFIKKNSNLVNQQEFVNSHLRQLTILALQQTATDTIMAKNIQPQKELIIVEETHPHPTQNDVQNHPKQATVFLTYYENSDLNPQNNNTNWCVGPYFQSKQEAIDYCRTGNEHIIETFWKRDINILAYKSLFDAVKKGASNKFDKEIETLAKSSKSFDSFIEKVHILYVKDFYETHPCSYTNHSGNDTWGWNYMTINSEDSAIFEQNKYPVHLNTPSNSETESNYSKESMESNVNDLIEDNGLIVIENINEESETPNQMFDSQPFTGHHSYNPNVIDLVSDSNSTLIKKDEPSKSWADMVEDEEEENERLNSTKYKSTIIKNPSHFRELPKNIPSRNEFRKQRDSFKKGKK